MGIYSKTIAHCDRCSAEKILGDDRMDKPEFRSINEWGELELQNMGTKDTDVRKLLCDKCKASLLQWLENK